MILNSKCCMIILVIGSLKINVIQVTKISKVNTIRRNYILRKSPSQPEHLNISNMVGHSAAATLTTLLAAALFLISVACEQSAEGKILRK